MQKVRSDHISPTLNIDRLNVGPSIGICAKSWVTWRTIQLALSFKNGSVGSFGTTKCCQGDTLYGLSRLELRCIVCAWRAVEISGFRICQGQIRNQKRAWEMFLWTSLTYYMYILYIYIYIVHFQVVHLLDYSQWFCLWRATPLGYPADDVDCLLAGQMATAEAPCHGQKIHRQCRQCDCITVPNAHLSPGFSKTSTLIWEMNLISGDLWTCRRRPSSLVSTRHMAKQTWNCNTSKRFKALLTWKNMEGQTETSSGQQHRSQTHSRHSHCLNNEQFL